MKVGDLVKFKDKYNGLAEMLGTIIAENGEGFDVLWNRTTKAAYRDDSRINTEMPEFLEVISESR